MNDFVTKPGKGIAMMIGISIVSGLIGGAIFVRIQGGVPGNTLSNLNIATSQSHYVEESDGIKAIEKVVPAVVSIVATKDLQVFRNQPLNPFFFNPQEPFSFGEPQQPQSPQNNQPEYKREKVAGGTGFIITADGAALTNKHVVADTGADYTAITKDGKEYDVEIISRDPVNDLAVIQLHEKTEDASDRKTGEKKNFGAKPTGLPMVIFGSSEDVKVGQKVFAIGNARGEYNNSVTSGIVSAIGREIQASEQGGSTAETLSGLIQTDAAINFGNSGGPLINMAGEVIGIDTAIDASATGVGFAIPVKQITPVLESVKKFGHIVRPYLGVTHIILNKDKAAELKLDSLDHGALIVGDRSKKEFGVVSGSPAEKAGLKMDDVILEVDGNKVTEDNTLQSMIQNHAPGDKLKLLVWRDGKTFDLTVTLEEKKE